MGHDGAFHGEAFDVLRFLGQETQRNQQWEIGVDVAGLFESAVEIALDGFPDGVAFGADDHASFDRSVIRELGGFDDVEVPLGIIDIAGFYVFGHGMSL